MTRQHVGVLFGGILLLAIAMGISRFAFTPILPYMRIDEGLTFQQGGLLASSNYIGYFIGALGAGFIYRHRKYYLLTNVLLNVASILLMGLTHSITLWLVFRLIAGITSGFIFVLTSSIIMDYLARHFLTKWSGFVFSGIGIGIAFSGLLVPFFETRFQWEGTWVSFGMMSILLFAITLYLWRKVDIHDGEKVEKSDETNLWQGFMPWLIIAYGLEGLGYIITGTFLVDIVYNIESLRDFASYSWVMVGVAAIPSAPIWMALMNRFSPIRLMYIAYSLQVIGISLPVLSQTVWSVLLSAFLYGMTFVGLVTLTTGYGRNLYPKQSGTVVSTLTTFYAAGQIIGPIIASRLEGYFNTFRAPLLFASFIVFTSIIILAIGQTIARRKKVVSSAEVHSN